MSRAGTSGIRCLPDEAHVAGGRRFSGGGFGSERFGLGLFPLFGTHFFLLMQMNESPLFVSDYDIRQPIAVDIGSDDLCADARVVVDQMRNEVDRVVSPARE